MRSGVALDDADRAPWLAAIGRVLADKVAHPGGVVVACSALKRAYRDRLRSASADCRFLYLRLPQAVAARRIGERMGHFMPPSLLDDQYATLEEPVVEEADVVTLDATSPLDRLIAQAVSAAAR